MRKRIPYKAVLCTLLWISASRHLASATIESVTGAWRHKQSVVITGADFGKHADSSPDNPSTLVAKFDDFEDGENDTPVTGWSIYPLGDSSIYRIPRYTNINQRTGSALSSYHNLTEPYSGSWFAKWHTTNEFYITYWRRSDIVSIGDPVNYKECRVEGTVGQRPLLAFDTTVMPPTSLKATFQASTDPYIGGIQYGCGSCVNDRWDRKEFWIRIGDTPGQRFMFWENAVLKRNYTTPEEFPYGVGPYLGDIGTFNVVYLGFWIREHSDARVQMDDVYIDTTQARVEIGDNPTWGQCTHREIQIPSAWSDTSITVTVNQGSFGSGSKAYLYVVDADGKVNAEGFPITFGDSEVPLAGPPGKPIPEEAAASLLR